MVEPIDDAEMEASADDQRDESVGSNKASLAVLALVDLLQAVAVRSDLAACAPEAGAAAVVFGQLGTSWQLQVMPPMLFLDGELGVVSAQHLAPLKQVAERLASLGIGVIAADGAVDGDSWLQFAGAVHHAATHGRAAMPPIAGIAVRAHPAPRPGADRRSFDVEVLASTTVGRLVDASPELAAPTEPWSWSRAASLLAGLERAHHLNAAACLRGLELEQAWSGGRGATSMALHVLRTLELVKVNATTKRAAMHAAYALGSHGLLREIGRPLKDAARAAFADLIAHFSGQDGTVNPATAHHAMVMSMVGAFASERVVFSALKGPLPLLLSLYEMERHRVEQPEAQRPSFTDLLAGAATADDGHHDTQWLAALARAAGSLCIGTAVRLPDGMVGVAADGGQTGHPLKPLVMHGSGFAKPDVPVAPLAM